MLGKNNNAIFNQNQLDKAAESIPDWDFLTSPEDLLSAVDSVEVDVSRVAYGLDLVSCPKCDCKMRLSGSMYDKLLSSGELSLDGLHNEKKQ